MGERNEEGRKNYIRGVVVGVQCCSPAVWAALTSQLETLRRSPEGLPRETLRQVFQVGRSYTDPFNAIPLSVTVLVTPSKEIFGFSRIMFSKDSNDTSRRGNNPLCITPSHVPRKGWGVHPRCLLPGRVHCKVWARRMFICHETAQAYMLKELEMPEGRKPAMPADLLLDAREDWVQQTKDLVTVSALQRDVERVLRLMGEHPTLEHVTDDGLFAVDLAFPGTTLLLPYATNLFECFSLKAAVPELSPYKLSPRRATMFYHL